jgi:hypothetical protein
MKPIRTLRSLRKSRYFCFQISYGPFALMGEGAFSFRKSVLSKSPGGSGNLLPVLRSNKRSF